MLELYVDFYRDWRRWSKAERLTAGLLLMMSVASAALFLS